MITDDGRDVEPGSGETGRVAVRGYTPIGYYKDPEKSAATFVTIDGATYSIPGDYATVEADGSLTLLGRGSVCINTGGEKVYPEEVEEVLKQHPSVLDAVAVGLPDDKFGEAITAVVQLQDAEASIDEQALISHVKDEPRVVQGAEEGRADRHHRARAQRQGRLQTDEAVRRRRARRSAQLDASRCPARVSSSPVARARARCSSREALSGLGHPCGHEVSVQPGHDTCAGLRHGRWRRVVVGSAVRRRSARRHGRAASGARSARDDPVARRYARVPDEAASRSWTLRYRLQHLHIRFARPIVNPRFVRFAAEHCPEAFESDDETSRAATLLGALEPDDRTGRPTAPTSPTGAIASRTSTTICSPSSTTSSEEARRRRGRGDPHRARHQHAPRPPGRRAHLADIRDAPIRSQLTGLAAEFGYDLSGR